MATPNPESRKRKPSKSISHHSIKKKSSNHSSSVNPNRIPLGKNKFMADKKKEEKPKEKETKKEKKKGSGEEDRSTVLLSTAPVAQQLTFFLHRFQSANGFKLSPLELEAFKDTCMIELSQGVDQDVSNFSKHVKAIFGVSWNQLLCDWRLSEGIDAGSPVLIVISASALRSLELLRGLKPFTAECRPVKLFAKHMKVEDQVTLLKTRVNIVCGTPSSYDSTTLLTSIRVRRSGTTYQTDNSSTLVTATLPLVHLCISSHRTRTLYARIKKLIDMDALLLSRLSAIVLDMHQDAKGYSLLTLPQVSAELWDLYKSHFHQKLLEGDSRICFYGPVPNLEIKKAIESEEQ